MKTNPSAIGTPPKLDPLGVAALACARSLITGLKSEVGRRGDLLDQLRLMIAFLRGHQYAESRRKEGGR